MRYSKYVIVFLLLQGCAKAPSFQSNVKIASVQTPVSAIVGDSIALGFEIFGEGMPYMILENALGTSTCKGVWKKGEIWFTLPAPFTQRSGSLKWCLTQNQKVSLSGIIEVLSSGPSSQLETYLGPRSIIAGNTDYSMLVTVPTDVYDNPIADASPVQILKQNRGLQEMYETETKDLISWKRIFTVEKASRIHLASSIQGNSSKELSVDVYPAKATGFEVFFNRNHEYSDGNQIISFETSIIKDKYDNTVSDGTMVTFQVINKNGVQLKTKGTTVNGVAMAQMLHPEQEDLWHVEAYVIGAAKSDKILIEFKPAILDYELQNSKDGRSIKVGPINSFMKQRIPDGMPVRINVYDEKNRLVSTRSATSINGYANFEMTHEHFKNGIYNIEVEIAGITKKLMFELHE